MEISFSEVHKEHSRDLYWVRVFVKDNLNQNSTLACASWEWLTDKFKVAEITHEELQSWLKVVEGDIKKYSTKQKRYLIYATTSEGKVNGHYFLSAVGS